MHIQSPKNVIVMLSIIISVAAFFVIGNHLTGQQFLSYAQTKVEAEAANDFETKQPEPVAEASSNADTKTEPATETETEETTDTKNNIDSEQIPDGPLIALTFDDGPSKTVTPVLLEELRKRGVVATFFVLGNRAERFSDIILEAYGDGHQIAIHGYDHKYKFTALNDKDLLWQVNTAADIVENITGERPTAVRPPYGAIDAATADKIDMPCVLWNVDTRDWASRNADKVAEHIVNNAEDGSIIILHDTFSSSVEGVIKAIDILSEQGYNFVTIDQLYAAKDLQFEAGGIYP